MVVPIDKLSILVTIAFSYLVFHEKLTKRAALGLVLIIAGKVEVMITYESDGELVPAYQREENENRSSNGTQESYSLSSSNKIVTVYEQGTTTALILMKKKPQVKGVIVIAQGASDLTVRMSLSQAVRTVLQVSADRVDIFEMK